MKTSCNTCFHFAEARRLTFLKTSSAKYCSLVQQPHWTGFGTKTFGTVHFTSGGIGLERTSHVSVQPRMRDVVEHGVFEMDEELIEFAGDFYVDELCCQLDCA